MVQSVLKLDDIPKDFPKKMSVSITAPIKNPEIYQGQVPKNEYIVISLFGKSNY
ncbi:hypothetical protein FLJC2902T_12550 [Flavobacterium limnosediminis JC2902]|uniref:Uncharacterized protein n=1 Tax=Flavobacterium limnosediminis JC2902 TaxID=1341181 RepID=V6SQF4_9FLAO|nr:hypothetical protein FLJC2902T_12550 [Flavobacterium limnosediminis JC2902]